MISFTSLDKPLGNVDKIIAEAVKARADSGLVVELGPGLGTLTGALLVVVVPSPRWP